MSKVKKEQLLEAIKIINELQAELKIQDEANEILERNLILLQAENQALIAKNGELEAKVKELEGKVEIATEYLENKYDIAQADADGCVYIGANCLAETLNQIKGE